MGHGHYRLTSKSCRTSAYNHGPSFLPNLGYTPLEGVVDFSATKSMAGIAIPLRSTHAPSTCGMSGLQEGGGGSIEPPKSGGGGRAQLTGTINQLL